MIHVTHHACQRWIERVDPHADIAAAKTAILANRALKIVETFAPMHCLIKLPTGQRIVISDRTVVTVLPR